jgi:hypothetical protein
MAYNEPTSAVEVTIYCPVEGEIGGRDRGERSGVYEAEGVLHTHTHTHTQTHTHILHRCSGLLQPMGLYRVLRFGSTWARYRSTRWGRRCMRLITGC